MNKTAKSPAKYWAGLAGAFLWVPIWGYGQGISDVSVPGAGEVWALAAQPDGKILLGGYFQFAGPTRYNLARVNADGTLDTDFRPPSGIGVVTALALQVDGKILVGANITNLAGEVVAMFERLNPDGSQDGTAVSGGPGDYVNALAVQEDGKILVGGPFKSFAGQARANLARLKADGSVDNSFNPTMGASPWCIVVQTDGKIVLGGPDFTSVDGQARKGLARLNADGTLDPGFNPNIAHPMSIALQGDGKIIVNGTSRLNTDGTLDGTFNSSLRAQVDGLAIQTDGRLLAAGWYSGLYRLNQDGSPDTTFTSLTNLSALSMGLENNGQIVIAGNPTLAVLTNTEPATESLNYLGTTVTWLRGGSSPEVWWTLFEYSTNGVDWASLGNGARVAGGWELSGVVLPPGCSVRASGAVAGGYFNDSFWLAQSYIGPPVFTTQPISRTNYVGTAARLRVFAQGSEPLNYQWLRNGIPVLGATSNTLSLPSLQSTDAGTYSVVVSNQFGSSTSSDATMAVLALPRIILNDGHFGFTANDQFGFDVTGPSGQTIVVEWSGTFQIWLPLQTNTLGNSPYYFSEPRSTKYPRKFYRVRVAAK